MIRIHRTGAESIISHPLDSPRIIRVHTIENGIKCLAAYCAEDLLSLCDEIATGIVIEKFSRRCNSLEKSFHGFCLSDLLKNRGIDRS